MNSQRQNMRTTHAQIDDCFEQMSDMLALYFHRTTASGQHVTEALYNLNRCRPGELPDSVRELMPMPTLIVAFVLLAEFTAWKNSEGPYEVQN